MKNDVQILPMHYRNDQIVRKILITITKFVKKRWYSLGYRWIPLDNEPGYHPPRIPPGIPPRKPLVDPSLTLDLGYPGIPPTRQTNPSLIPLYRQT